MVRDGDLFGDGVNIRLPAGRVQPAWCVCRMRPISLCIGPADELRSGAAAGQNIDLAVRAYLARPADAPPSPVLPPVHRRAMAHLSRRFNDLCSNAANVVTGREGLEPIEFATLASVHDAPGNDCLRLAERIGVPLPRHYAISSALRPRPDQRKQPGSKGPHLRDNAAR
jgi:hypothetical protein